MIDEYWNKFISDGKIDSYLEYKEHLKAQGSVDSGTNTVYDRRPDYSGTKYW
ncbi:MAG: hypothetical protein UIG59_07775 [Acutalibacteraceae bacterium]|nr:hypothetical protein [Acutalibacteraceae bacterium]